MVLLNPKGMVDSVLKTSKVDKVMPIVYELDQAIQLLDGVPGQPSTPRPALDTSEYASGTEQAELESAAPIATEGALKLSIKNERAELQGLNDTLAQFLDGHSVPYRASYAVNLAIDESGDRRTGGQCDALRICR